MIKNRVLTEKKLIAAVGEVIKKKGYKGLSLNGVAKEAGMSRTLIYRYFGDIDALVETYIQEKDYWLGDNPDFKLGVTGIGDKTELEQLIIQLLQRQLDYFMDTEEMQSIILSELSEDHQLLKHLSESRETLAAPFFDLTDAYFKDTDVDFRGIAALVVSGIYYLVLQSKRNDAKCCGVNLRTEAGKKSIANAISLIIHGAFLAKA